MSNFYNPVLGDNWRNAMNAFHNAKTLLDTAEECKLDPDSALMVAVEKNYHKADLAEREAWAEYSSAFSINQ